MFKAKKGIYRFQDIITFAMIFVVAVITIGVGANVVTGVQAGQTANSYAYNASTYGLTGLNTMASNMPTLATVIVASIIISVLMLSFVMGSNR